HICAFIDKKLKTPQFAVIPYINEVIETTDHIDEMKETLFHLLNNVQDPNFHAIFFVLFASATKKEPKKYSDLFQVMINKMSPEYLSHICRHLLKTDILNDKQFNFVTEVLICIYKRNKELYADIPGFCTGVTHEAVREAKCSV